MWKVENEELRDQLDRQNSEITKQKNKIAQLEFKLDETDYEKRRINQEKRRLTSLVQMQKVELDICQKKIRELSLSIKIFRRKLFNKAD